MQEFKEYQISLNEQLNVEVGASNAPIDFVSDPMEFGVETPYPMVYPAPVVLAARDGGVVGALGVPMPERKGKSDHDETICSVAMENAPNESSSHAMVVVPSKSPSVSSESVSSAGKKSIFQKFGDVVSDLDLGKGLQFVKTHGKSL